MKYDFKEFEEQDLNSKGPMRRRYDEIKEISNGYVIYQFIRGEYTRYSVEDERGNVYVETDNFDEAKEFLESILKK
jgi:hypothetical protein